MYFSLAKHNGSRTIGQLLNLGVNIIAIFSVLFIYYTNSFLLKRRQNELGLYSVLGMEKKQINRVLIFENIYSSGLALIFGVLFGTLFSKLMFAFLLNIINLDTSIKLNLTFQPVLMTGLVYISIFALVGIKNKIKINKTNPIDLLKGAQKGEKEPESNWFLGLVGLIALGIGYYLALTIEKPLEAFLAFFIAALLVIIGTYLTFTSGSIIIIKLLRKNKYFYYKKNNFIPLSNMLYRMKQNAVGLANIAVLSSAVLLILSTTTSLYVGIEDVVNNTFPKDVVTNYIYDGQDPEEIEEVILEHADKSNVEIKNPLKYYNLHFPTNRDGNSFQKVTGAGTAHNINVINLRDYNRIYEDNLKLKDGQVFISGDLDDFDYNTINVFEKNYGIKAKLDPIDFTAEDSFNRVDIVVSDFEEVEFLGKIVNSNPINYDYHFDLKGTIEDKIIFSSSLRDKLNESISRVAIVQDKFTTREDILSKYGSLFFIGILLGTVFMVATVLIIYYKQITEGYEDKKQFKILQDIGMSKKEVEKTINKQVLFVFFLPLITAVINIMVAFPLVNKILHTLGLQNTKLFLISTGIVIVIFGISYTIVYRWTAKMYYRIVN